MTETQDQTAHDPVPPEATGSTAADAALKAKHRAMWALGSYPTVARELIADFGPVLVDALGLGRGTRVLDVAAGTGNVAVPAARAGAEVVASDLTPELLADGQAQAEAEGVELTWLQADAEDLPLPDASFDAVVSAVGVMFAPHHQAAAEEILRVCRPGGRIGLISWTPGGFIGQMFAAMKPFVAPPPPGASPPPLWGSAEHVAGLFGDGVRDLVAEHRTVRVDQFAEPGDFLGFFKEHYGPTIAAYRGLAETPDRAAELDEKLRALGPAFAGSDGSMEWEYLLLTATRA